jgi:hypothetical protein
MLTKLSSLHRRAILIYIATIVAPVGGLLCLGIQSFEGQRQALATLTTEKLDAAVEARTRAAEKRVGPSPTPSFQRSTPGRVWRVAPSEPWTVTSGRVPRPARRPTLAPLGMGGQARRAPQRQDRGR